MVTNICGTTDIYGFVCDTRTHVYCPITNTNYLHHSDSLVYVAQESAERVKNRMAWLYALLRKKPAHKGCGPQKLIVAKGRGVCPIRPPPSISRSSLKKEKNGRIYRNQNH